VDELGADSKSIYENLGVDAGIDSRVIPTVQESF
jgi:hypothetical protein